MKSGTLTLDDGRVLRFEGHLLELMVGLHPAQREVNAIVYGEVTLSLKPGKAVPAFVRSGPPIVLG